MILGIGSDITDIRRIESVLEKHGHRFVSRCFTKTEIDRADSRRAAGTAADVYAKRFAAKEACAKALGTGISQGVFLRDIGVVNDPGGRPRLSLTGGAKDWLESMTPHGKTARLHLSISDEYPYAKAFVVIEAL